MGRFRGRPRTGRLILRLKPAAAAELVACLANTGSYPATLHDVVSVIGHNADPLQTILGHPGIEFRPAVPPQFAGAVRQNEAEQQASELAPLRTLLSYFLVDPGNSQALTSSLIAELEGVPIVEFVQPEPAVIEAAGTWVVNPNDFNSIDSTTYHGLHTEAFKEAFGQKYYGLNCACDAVWGKYGGAGVGFIDLEAAWHLGHSDLSAVSIAAQPIWNFNCFNDVGARSHGTRSLGVVVGADNERGVVGIAPRATFYGVVSRAEIDTSSVLADPNKCADITGAIVAAVHKMNPGDVLLTEVQTVAGTTTAQGVLFDFAPIEIVDLWFDALRYAAGYGVTVIEPAGNGNFDLDSPGWTWNMGGRSLDRDGGGAAFKDSGAVMVSGCSAKVNSESERLHTADAGVNSGSRIDCYGWMTDVGSTDVTNSGADSYDGTYGGTSAASAMIAGAAILVQEMYRSSHAGNSASPMQVRQLLSAYGSPVKGTGRVVPDLELVAGAVGALPDVFVRDSVDDDGTVPSSMVSMSPDIIIRNSPIADPDGAFGNGSGFEDAFLDNDDIVPDAVNYVFVRVRNRNTVAAGAVRATVYWADTMVFVPPTEWSEIDTTAEAPVAAAPAEGVPGPVRILGPLEWWPVSGASPPQCPASHGCLVAVIDAVGDPRPAVFPSLGGLVTSWTNFTDIIGANNNLAYRNFNVISLTPTEAGDVAGVAEVIIPGAPVAEAFEILVRVPACEGVEWDLLVPRRIARHFGADRSPRAEGIPDEFAVVPLKPGSSLRVRDVPIGARQRHRCIVRVRAPRVPDKRCWIYLTQRLRDIELGRVTFSVGPRPPRERKRDDDGHHRRPR